MPCPYQDAENQAFSRSSEPGSRRVVARHGPWSMSPAIARPFLARRARRGPRLGRIRGICREGLTRPIRGALSPSSPHALAGPPGWSPPRVGPHGGGGTHEGPRRKAPRTPARSARKPARCPQGFRQGAVMGGSRWWNRQRIRACLHFPMMTAPRSFQLFLRTPHPLWARFSGKKTRTLRPSGFLRYRTMSLDAYGVFRGSGPPVVPALNLILRLLGVPHAPHPAHTVMNALSSGFKALDVAQMRVHHLARRDFLALDLLGRAHILRENSVHRRSFRPPYHQCEFYFASACLIEHHFSMTG